ncbi:replication endonuclease [Teichococcus aestuarii]|uniref:replication endonuclease n=2 Tax=Teichococcus aestuarii TaxID=568898 RepID=UPI00361424BB
MPDCPQEALRRELEEARAAALATLGRVERLPRLHADAVLRLAAQQARRSLPDIDTLHAGVLAQRGAVRWERAPGSTPITAAGVIAQVLAEIEPPAHECSAEGAALVRGDEDAIRTAAQRAARRWSAWYEARDAMRQAATASGTPLRAVDEQPWIRRERTCARWHTRRLRREALRAQAYYDTALRLARPGHDYVSSYTLGAWRQRQERQQAWAEAKEVQWDDGSVASLAAVRDSAARARGAALYAISRGHEHWATSHGYTAFFLTLTLPGAYHSYSSGARAADGTYPHQRPNEDWTRDHGPRRAWAELQSRWARLRAILADRSDDLRAHVGVVVPEPHRDGTPHLHALVYLPWIWRDQHGAEHGTAWELRRALRTVCPGPRAARLEVVRRVPGRRTVSPATYVMKYILKSLNDEQTLREQGEAGERHRAWASSRGLRRMRVLGSHGVLRAWQRLWTLSARQDRAREAAADRPVIVAATDEDGDADGMAILPERAEAAMAAMRRARASGAVAEDMALSPAERALARERQAGHYADALALLGGLPGGQGCLRLTYAAGESEYGRPTKRPDGLVDPATGEWMPLRDQGARIVASKLPCQQHDLTVVASRPRAGADAPAPSAVPPPQNSRQARREAEMARDYDRIEAIIGGLWGPEAPQAPPPACGPPPVAPIRRRPMLTMVLDDLAEAA